MNKVYAPSLSNSKKSTSDMIIYVLMYEHPLTLAKLTSFIKKKFHVAVTFQGIRKAANHLVEQGVLLKNDKDYSISKDWIKKLGEFAHNLYDLYYLEESGIKNLQTLGEDIQIYTFDNLIDLDKSWNRIIGRWFDEDAANKGKKYYVQQSGHTWYVLGQMEEETSILEKIKKHNINFYTFAVGNTLLDGWCRRYYEGQGFYYTNGKKKADTSKYFAVYNDNIIQTEYPKGLNREIDKIYNNARNFENFDATSLISLLRQKVDLKVTVMKNAGIAEQLRNVILSAFYN